MLNILASGTLVADPRRRTSANGKDYATASVRVPAEDADAMLVSVIAFDADAVAAILALSRGDSVAIAGRAKLTSWKMRPSVRRCQSLAGLKLQTGFDGCAKFIQAVGH